MNNPIIVYHNSLQQTLWEGALPLFVPFVIAIMIWFILLYVGVFLLHRSKISPYSRKYDFCCKALLVIAGFAAGGIASYLM